MTSESSSAKRSDFPVAAMSSESTESQNDDGWGAEVLAIARAEDEEERRREVELKELKEKAASSAAPRPESALAGGDLRPLAIDAEAEVKGPPPAPAAAVAAPGAPALKFAAGIAPRGEFRFGAELRLEGKIRGCVVVNCLFGIVLAWLFWSKRSRYRSRCTEIGSAPRCGSAPCRCKRRLQFRLQAG